MSLSSFIWSCGINGIYSFKYWCNFWSLHNVTGDIMLTKQVSASMKLAFWWNINRRWLSKTNFLALTQGQCQVDASASSCYCFSLYYSFHQKINPSPADQSLIYLEKLESALRKLSRWNAKYLYLPHIKNSSLKHNKYYGLYEVF